MTSQEHSDLLMQGIAGWNVWRKENPSITPNLRNANLARLNLTGADLVSAELTDADLSETDLTGTDLRLASLNFSPK